MVKKISCCFAALVAIIGILFLVHAKVDSFHGSTDHAVSIEQDGDAGAH